jgi:hypothetical protein
VNPAEADKEIRGQLVSTLESGHAHMAFAEATKAFPTSAINSRLPGVLQLLASRRAHTPRAKGHARLYGKHVI